jgi:hypothetical protein
VDYFEKRARAEFGSPQAIAEIAALFTRVEAAKGDPALETITYTRPGGFHRLRRIPASWLADRFEDLWRRTHQGNSPSWGDVLACYDADDTLVGIEFYASRYGCFATRDATRCPPGFDLDTLHRLANQPILVIIRVAAPD